MMLASESMQFCFRLSIVMDISSLLSFIGMTIVGLLESQFSCLSQRQSYSTSILENETFPFCITLSNKISCCDIEKVAFG